MSAIAEIKRLTELYLAQAIRNNLTTGTLVVPYRGGSESQDGTEIEPPFVVVAVGSAERRISTEDTYQITGTIQVVSHLTESTSQEYAQLVDAVHLSIRQIRPGSTSTFRLHGIDITDHRSASDDEAQAYADLIDFTAGVSG